ncbi:crotonase/enoyl-CoA hydratase family protein [Aeromicrobium sp.]|uniref:crotonase/enoyl-CoA hydratase family protein n=1 Tax=Aeromicrobium sp. TaxID=1871063 RepID=UPI002FC9B9C7
MSAVLTERRGRVLLITLNRPEALNAVNTELANGLAAAVELLDSDPDLTVGILTGSGRGFCSGMDLKAFAAEGPPKGFETFLSEGSEKPLIAAIEGFALAGGLEIALICDLLVAAKGSKFGIPETRVGLFAAGGALFRLPNRVPFGVAMELALTADSISAETASGYGLISRLAEPGTAVDVAFELAERIAKNGPLGVRASKQLIRRSIGISEAEAWKLQDDYAPGVFESEDAVEGPKAFAEKRPPVWAGR